MTIEQHTTRIERWTIGGLPRDVERSLERLATADDVRHLAVMPDVHLANDVCVGTAIATTRLIYPAAVGGDIGCGMSALALGVSADTLDDEHVAARVLHGLGRAVPSNRHPPASAPDQLPNDLDAQRLSESSLAKLAGRDGRVQLGTLGRGNHFVELQSDDENQLWLMLHSGSRAMGQAISALHRGRAATSESGLQYLDAETPEGRAYLADVAWGIDYARANRRAMAEAIVDRLADPLGIEPDWSSWIDCHHDHVQREKHDGREFWVHRKGALPADDGQPGVIPGSMGTCSFHVVGRGHAASLRSASHGAGRVLHRSEARRRIGARRLEREMQGIWFDHRLRHRLRDEAPSAYKDVREVLRAQRDLVRIVRELRPRLVYKGT